MNIAITGATGLVGSTLFAQLAASDHNVRRIVRSSLNDDDVLWNPMAAEIDEAGLKGVDAVVHLAGESIAEGRWTQSKKARIRDSRVVGTRLLCQTLADLSSPPRVLVAASAIGFYGDRGDQECSEATERGVGFLPDVCVDWEAATQSAAEAGIRVVNLRIGVVLSSAGGALAKMLLPFRSGLGGRVGNGRQWWSWISIDDTAGAIIHALNSDSLSGPVNAVSPHAVTNSEFTKTLGRVLRRPTVFPMPAFAARLLLGDMANGLLLASTRVVPEKLVASGFSYEQATLEDSLRHVLNRPSPE